MTEQTTVLELRHTIAASRKRVFAAWTTPEDIQHWFGPETCRVQSARVDLRVGGEYCFDIFSRRTGETQIRGICKEVLIPERLVYTWQCSCDGELPGEESLVTVVFIDLGSSTEIRLRHEQLPNTQVSDDHRHGWIGTFEKLVRYIGA